MGVRILTGLLAIIVVLCVCSGAANAATIDRARRTERAAAPGAAGGVSAPSSRQNDEGYSDEDSDEDDDEQESDNAQQFYQQQQQIQEDSLEDSDEEGDDDQDDVYRRRRRRDVDMVVVEPAVPDVPIKGELDIKPEANQAEKPTQDDVKKPDDEDVIPAITPAPPSRKPSAIILIRDALKKVTALQTAQVAKNALQYIPLAEHEEGDDDQDDVHRRRRRRDVDMVVVEPAVPDVLIKGELDKKPEANQAEKPTQDDVKKPDDEDVIPAITPAPPSRKPSVLILIRDALKKVTTLPTAQVATNALQYFQLFEHFLQQTIEEVIGAVDDDDEDTTTVKPDIVITPNEPEEVIKEPELVTKSPEASKPVEPEMLNKPLEATIVEKPAEPEVFDKPLEATIVEKPAEPPIAAKPVEPEIVKKPALPEAESLTPTPGITVTKAPDGIIAAPSVVELKPVEHKQVEGVANTV